MAGRWNLPAVFAQMYYKVSAKTPTRIGVLIMTSYGFVYREENDELF